MGDTEYAPEFEGKSWTLLVQNGKAPSDHADLIRALQVVHDWDCPSHWSVKLSLVALRFNLTFNPPVSAVTV